MKLQRGRQSTANVSDLCGTIWEGLVRKVSKQGVGNLIHNLLLVDKITSYGEGCVCTELLFAGVNTTKKLKSQTGLIEKMYADTQTVGFILRARAGDESFPHKAPFMQRLQQERA